MIKNLAGAKKYVNKIKDGLIENPFASKDIAHSLKFLAQDKDEENFRLVVDLWCHGISTQKNLKLYSKEPLALVESFCMVLDHPEKANHHMFQTYRGIKMKRLPIGNTQKFFQKIYGSRFFKRDWDKALRIIK